MMTVTRRRGMLGGILGLTLMAWAIDLIGGDATPKEADAVTLAVETADPSRLATVGERAKDILERLQTGSKPRTGPPAPGETGRNLFALTGPAWAAFREPKPEAKTAQAPARPPDTIPVERPFAQTHVLRGVVAGDFPLALVNDRIVSAGTLIDGYRVLEIRRDRVRFRGCGGIVTLVVQGPEKAPPPLETAAKATSEEKKAAQIKSVADLVDLLNSK